MISAQKPTAYGVGVNRAVTFQEKRKTYFTAYNSILTFHTSLYLFFLRTTNSHPPPVKRRFCTVSGFRALNPMSTPLRGGRPTKGPTLARILRCAAHPASSRMVHCSLRAGGSLSATCSQRSSALPAGAPSSSLPARFSGARVGCGASVQRVGLLYDSGTFVSGLLLCSVGCCVVFACIMHACT